MRYDVLKNRLTNGNSFLRTAALERIAALADALEITQQQADELTAIAQEKGTDILPDDAAQGRLGKIERTIDAFFAAARESAVLSPILERMVEIIG